MRTPVDAAAYERFFASLPEEYRREILRRGGGPTGWTEGEVVPRETPQAPIPPSPPLPDPTGPVDPVGDWNRLIAEYRAERASLEATLSALGRGPEFDAVQDAIGALKVRAGPLRAAVEAHLGRALTDAERAGGIDAKP